MHLIPSGKRKKIQIDYPSDLADGTDPKSVTITQKGCSFCYVAKDKGFMGKLGDKAVK